MRILLLTHSFNSLTQRLYAELADRGHEVSVEFDIGDSVTEEAVALFHPEVVLAPFLKRAIPASVWKRVLCLVVHPGIEGDRGPSALDWAILRGEREWGVTVLQADAELDAGDIWATATFRMRAATKSSLYRNEVTEAACRAVLTALECVDTPGFRPRPLDYGRPGVRGRARAGMKQRDRAIDWNRDDTPAVLRRIRSADGYPGVRDTVAGLPCFLFDAHQEGELRGRPGELLARRGGAVCRATRDGAVWIGQLRTPGTRSFKLPATQVLGERIADLPTVSLGPFDSANGPTYRDLWYEECDGVGYLHFDFHNGAMATDQCRRLLDAYRQSLTRSTRVLVLMGGADFWSNGLHLHRIEAAESPADESWRNINAMNDLVEAILRTDDRIVVAALRGNAGAGGVFLALAADWVIARDGAVLNPHYRNMGNLYGSEYWTYTLPRRLGERGSRELMERRLPLLGRQAVELGLIDVSLDADGEALVAAVRRRAEALAGEDAFAERVELKRRRRREDEDRKPLAVYRQEELARMELNFYGFDPSYHVARYEFVHRRPLAWTPLHLAVHRRQGADTRPGRVAQ